MIYSKNILIILSLVLLNGCATTALQKEIGYKKTTTIKPAFKFRTDQFISGVITNDYRAILCIKGLLIDNESLKNKSLLYNNKSIYVQFTFPTGFGNKPFNLDENIFNRSLKTFTLDNRHVKRGCETHKKNDIIQSIHKTTTNHKIYKNYHNITLFQYYGGDIGRLYFSRGNNAKHVKYRINIKKTSEHTKQTECPACYVLLPFAVVVDVITAPIQILPIIAIGIVGANIH